MTGGEFESGSATDNRRIAQGDPDRQ